MGCFNCNQPGHTWANCPYPLSGSRTDFQNKGKGKGQSKGQGGGGRRPAQQQAQERTKAAPAKPKDGTAKKLRRLRRDAQQEQAGPPSQF